MNRWINLTLMAMGAIIAFCVVSFMSAVWFSWACAVLLQMPASVAWHAAWNEMLFLWFWGFTWNVVVAIFTHLVVRWADL